MPLMPSDIPQTLEAILKVIYLEEVAKQEPSYTRVCTQVDTTQETQDYGWVGSPPAIREFIEERVGKGLAVSGFKLTDKTWEATLAINRRALENDQMGEIKARVRELARRMVAGVDELAWTILRESYAQTGATAYGYSWDNYDKNGAKTASTIFFADSDHVYPAPAEYTTAQNNVGSTGLSAAELFVAYNKMMTWKDDRGKIIPYKPDMLITGPGTFKTGLELLSTVTFPVASAPAYNQVTPSLGLQQLYCPYWVDVAAGNAKNCWALACTTGVTKPLILQVFTPAANGQLFEFSALEGNSDNGFMRDMYYYGIRGRWNIGYGDWRSWYMEVVT